MADMVSAREVGKLSVRIVPDADNFGKDLKNQIDRAVKRIEKQLDPVNVDAALSDDAANDLARGLRRDIHDVERRAGKIDVKAGLDKQSDAQLRAEIEELTREKKIDFTPDMARAKLDRLRAVIDRATQDRKPQVLPYIDPFTRKKLEAQLDKLSEKRGVKLTLDADIDTAKIQAAMQKAEGNVKALQKEFDKLRQERNEVTGYGAWSKIPSDLQERIKKLSNLKAKVQVDVDDEEANHRLKSFKDKWDKTKVTFQAAVDATLAWLHLKEITRPRVVLLIAKWKQDSLNNIKKTIANWTGMGGTWDFTKSLGSWFRDLPKALPKMSAVIMGVNALFASVVSATSGILAFGAGLGDMLPGLLLIPGLLVNSAVAAVAFGAAIKDAPTELKSLGSQFGELQDILSENFWDKARQPILDLVNHLMPQLRGSMEDTATSLGNLTGGFASELEKSLSGGRLEYITSNLSKSIDILASGTDSFANALVNLSAVAASYMPGIAQWFVDLADTFDNWLSAVSTDGRLDAWMQEAKTALFQLWNTAGNLIVVFENLWKAADAGGSDGLAGIERLTKAMADITGSKIFQKGMQKVFSGSNDAIDVLTDSVKKLGRALAGTPIDKWIGTLGKGLSHLVDGFSELLSTASAQSGLTAFFDGIEKAAQIIGTVLPKLGPGIQALGTMIGQVLPTIATAFSGVLESLSALMPQITQAIGPEIVGLANAFSGALQLISGALQALGPAGTVLISLAANMMLVNRAIAMFNPGAASLKTALTAFKTGFTEAQTTAGMLGTKMTGLSGIFTTAKSGLRGVGGALSGAFGGPIGLAITGVASAISVFAGAMGGLGDKAAAQKAAIDSITDSLNDQTGAFTANTKAAVYKQMTDKGLISKMQTAGVNAKDAVDAALGDPSAINRVKAALDQYNESQKKTMTGHQLAAIGADGLTTKTEELRNGLLGVNGVVKQSAVDAQAQAAAYGDVAKQVGTIMQLQSVNAAKGKNSSVITTPSPEAIKRLQDAGYTLQKISGSQYKVSLNTADAQAALDKFKGKLKSAVSSGDVDKQVSAIKKVSTAAQALGKTKVTLPAPSPAVLDGLKQAGIKYQEIKDKSGKLKSIKLDVDTTGAIDKLKAIDTAATGSANNAKDAGKKVGSAFSSGIKDAKPQAAAAANNLVQGVATISVSSKGLKASGTKAGNAFANGLKAAQPKVTAAVKTLTSSVKAGSTPSLSAAGKKAGTTFATGIRSTKAAAQAAAKSLTNSIKSSSGVSLSSAGAKSGTTFARGLSSGVKGAVSAVKSTISAVKSAAGSASLTAAGKKTGSSYAKGVTSAKGSTKSASKALGSAARSGTNISLYGAGASVANSYVRGLRSKLKAIASAAKAMGDTTKANKGPESYDKVMLRDNAHWVVQGYVNGLNEKHKDVAKAASALGDATENAFRDRMEIHSPSKRFKKLGTYLVQGLAKGIKASQSETVDAINSLIEKIDSTSTKKMSKAQKKKMAQAKASLKAQTKLTASLWDSNIKNESPAEQTRLRALDNINQVLAAAKKGHATMADIAKARELLAQQIDTATQNLEDAIATRDNFKQSVIDAMHDLTDIGSMWQDTEETITETINGQQVSKTVTKPFTVDDYLQKLQDRYASINRFKDYMKTLNGWGLDKWTYSDLVNAYMQTGDDSIAKALVAAGKSKVSAAAKWQNQINAAATDLGYDASQVLYQPGVDLARGILEGLQSKESALLSYMTTLANKLKNQLKKAWGIHSPSRVAKKEIGAMWGKGLALGIQGEENTVMKASNKLASAAMRADANFDKYGNTAGIDYSKTGGDKYEIDASNNAQNPAEVANEVIRRLRFGR